MANKTGRFTLVLPLFLTLAVGALLLTDALATVTFGYIGFSPSSFRYTPLIATSLPPIALLTTRARPRRGRRPTARSVLASL